MPPSPNLELYATEVALMNKAQAAGGLRVECLDPAAAARLRFRCYSAREAERRLNAKMYGAEEPQHGTSSFDGLTFRVSGPFLLIYTEVPIDLSSMKLTTLTGEPLT